MTRPGLTWLLFAFYIPAILQLVFSVVHKRSDFFISSWVNFERHSCPPLPLPSLSCVVQCGLLVSISAFVALILTYNEETTATALAHSSAWAVLLAWIFCLIKVATYCIYSHTNIKIFFSSGNGSSNYIFLEKNS